jgi:hypothetical protein
MRETAADTNRFGIDSVRVFASWGKLQTLDSEVISNVMFAVMFAVDTVYR